jgi:hypothetical protein
MAGETSEAPQLTAGSMVTPVEDFTEIIRMYSEEYQHYNGEPVKCIHMHNSFAKYVSNVVKKYDSSVTAISLENEPLLRRICRVDTLDPRNMKLKWAILKQNILAVDGKPIRPRVMDPEFYVNQYEPRSVNYDNVDKEEALARRRLQESWKHFDRTSKRPNTSDIPSTSRSSENSVKKWDFQEIKKEQEKQESEDENQKPEEITIQESKNNEDNEPRSKKLKLDPESDVCILCRENDRTHAFLHGSLESDDASAHLVACEQCAFKWQWATKGCPFCRKPCVNILRIMK